jgi:formylglycine-generating enzyme required for sulfatase activity
MEDLIGKQLGPYQIISQLGIGGMATVFKAYQPKMDRYIALKVIPRHFSKNPEFISRFSQEARVIAQLEHPHILPVHDFGEADGYTYLAMRLVEGGTLSDLIKAQGKLELAKINTIIYQAGGALGYAHSKGIIHRDFKPGNVLMDEFDNCLLTDFGIAKLVEVTSHLTHTGGILGTPNYIAPEQGEGKPIDSRSDIYSLGIVLYQMVVGDVPYKADTPMAVVYKHINDPLPLPRQRVPDLPEAVERVILKAIAKKPEDRFSTAPELANALQSALQLPIGQTQEIQPRDPDVEPFVAAIETPDAPAAVTGEPSGAPIKETIEPKEKVRTGRGLAYGVLAIILLAVLGGAGLYYYKNIFSAGPLLTIESNPTGADVYVDEGHVGMSPVEIKTLTPGAHQVRITKDRYEDYQGNVFIQEKKPRSIKADLVPVSFGDLEVVSNPSGAEVFIDDVQKGTTPIALEGLSKGTRKVVVKKEGFEPWQSMVEIVPLKKVQVFADFFTNYGGLNIASDPSGADVYVDGKKVGKTPLSLKKIKKGAHKINIHKTAFAKWNQEVMVEASKVAEVNATLFSGFGSLKVKTVPEGADIFIDGKKFGKSPLEIKKIKKGSVTVEAKKTCYGLVKKKVKIPRGKPAEVRFNMQTVCGDLAVASEPSGAEWYLDGKYIGKTPGGKKNVVKGLHEVVVKKKGYNAWAQNANVLPGQKAVLQASLSVAGPAPKVKNSLGMAFVYINPGKFMMGSPDNEPGRDSDENQHQVTLSKGFYMQTTEVTQVQWREIMGSSPSYFKNCGGDCPVERVSWNQVQNFINKLNKREGNVTYRLPTEAEWEYAARAGIPTAFANGRILDLKCGPDANLNAMGWYCGNANRKVHPVAQKHPNSWGLYDMHGNVREWCQDWFGDYPSGPVTDPVGPSVSLFRATRGGSWFREASYCRSADRGMSFPYADKDADQGFRLVREP